MRVGLVPAGGNGVEASPAYISEYVRAAEECGFDSVWMGEHPALPAAGTEQYPGRSEGLSEPSGVPLPDPLEWLAFAAAHTTTLLLGTAVLILPLHPPAVLAKRAATLDQISGGRLHLGVGLGWNRGEYEACGANWQGRAQRMEEAIGAMRSLWSSEVAAFEGETVSFPPVFSAPKPSAGTVPVHIGASAAAGARRAGRLGDGYLPFERDAGELERLVLEMRAAAVDAGRDPASIEITALGSTRADRVRELATLGVTRMLFFAPDPDKLPDLWARVADVGAEPT